MSSEDGLLITLTSDAASDGLGYVGVVAVGEQEAYRTIRVRTSGIRALHSAQLMLAGALGNLLAGQEWRDAQEEFGHAPRRVELEFGLGAHAKPTELATTVEGHPSGSARS